MPARIQEEPVLIAVAKLMLGESRPMIAASAGISEGKVNDISLQMDKIMPDGLFKLVRQIFQEAKKQEISPVDVLAGYRVSVILEKSQIDIQQFASWVIQLFQMIKEKNNMEPSQVANLLSILSNFIQSEQTALDKLPDKIRTLTTEKQNLENHIDEERKNIKLLQDKRKSEEELLKKQLEENNVIRTQLKEFKDADKQLAKYGLSTLNIAKLMPVLKNIEQAGYSADRIIQYLGKVDGLEKQVSDLEITIRQKTSELESLKQQIQFEEQGYYEYIQVRKIGFGAPELQMLRNKVVGLTKVNGGDEKKAVEKFVNDIASQYDTKLGFEKNIEKLKKDEHDLRIVTNYLNSENGKIYGKLQEMQKDENTLKKANDAIRSDISDNIKAAQEQIFKLPEIIKVILDDMNSRREKLLEARQLYLASVLKVESLATLARAMSGEKIDVKSYIGDLEKIIDFFLRKAQKGSKHYRILMDMKEGASELANMKYIIWSWS